MYLLYTFSLIVFSDIQILSFPALIFSPWSSSSWRMSSGFQDRFCRLCSGHFVLLTCRFTLCGGLLLSFTGAESFVMLPRVRSGSCACVWLCGGVTVCTRDWVVESAPRCGRSRKPVLSPTGLWQPRFAHVDHVRSPQRTAVLGVVR